MMVSLHLTGMSLPSHAGIKVVVVSKKRPQVFVDN